MGAPHPEALLRRAGGDGEPTSTRRRFTGPEPGVPSAVKPRCGPAPLRPREAPPLSSAPARAARPASSRWVRTAPAPTAPRACTPRPGMRPRPTGRPSASHPPSHLVLHTTPAACELPTSFACLAISVLPGRRPVAAHRRRRLRQMCNRAGTPRPQEAPPSRAWAAVQVTAPRQGRPRSCRSHRPPLERTPDGGVALRPASAIGARYRDSADSPPQCRLTRPMAARGP